MLLTTSLFKNSENAPRGSDPESAFLVGLNLYVGLAKVNLKRKTYKIIGLLLLKNFWA